MKISYEEAIRRMENAEYFVDKLIDAIVERDCRIGDWHLVRDGSVDWPEDSHLFE